MLTKDTTMGYVHNFTFFKAPKGQAAKVEKLYQLAIRDCQRIVRHYSKEYGGLKGYSAHCPIGAYGGLQVNGSRDNGHAPLELREHYVQNIDIEPFIKTERKPYDVVVTACLSVLKHRLGDCLYIQSDGKASDWNSGVELARKVTGLKLTNPMKY